MHASILLVLYCTAVFRIGAAYYRELESFSAAGDRRVHVSTRADLALTVGKAR